MRKPYKQNWKKQSHARQIRFRTRRGRSKNQKRKRQNSLHTTTRRAKTTRRTHNQRTRKKNQRQNNHLARKLLGSMRRTPRSKPTRGRTTSTMGTLRMGTLTALLPIIGLISGKILAKLTPSELKQGKKYFQLAQHFLLAVTTAVLFGNHIYSLIIGAFVFTVLWKTKYEHPLELMPILFIPALLVQTTQIPIFLYLIPTGTLNYNKNIWLATAIYSGLTIISSTTF